MVYLTLSRHYELASNAGQRTLGFLVAVFKFTPIKPLDFYDTSVQILPATVVFSLYARPMDFRKVKQVYN